MADNEKVDLRDVALTLADIETDLIRSERDELEAAIGGDEDEDDKED